MLPDTVDELRTLYREAFDSAEKALKRFERIGTKTLLSSINQLRYAARHYLESEQAESEADVKEGLKQAVCHCKRAEYDAVEASVAMVCKSIVGFDRTYAISSILKIVPDYAEAYAQASRSMVILRDAGSVRDYDELSAAAKEKNAALEKLLVFWDDLSAKMPLVRKAEEERISEKRSQYRRWIIGTFIAALTLILTVVFGMAAK